MLLDDYKLGKFLEHFFQLLYVHNFYISIFYLHLY